MNSTCCCRAAAVRGATCCQQATAMERASPSCTRPTKERERGRERGTLLITAAPQDVRVYRGIASKSAPLCSRFWGGGFRLVFFPPSESFRVQSVFPERGRGLSAAFTTRKQRLAFTPVYHMQPPHFITDHSLFFLFFLKPPATNFDLPHAENSQVSSDDSFYD